MDENVFVWKCPRCGKEIRSLYENQFELNKELHETSCEAKEAKK